MKNVVVKFVKLYSTVSFLEKMFIFGILAQIAKLFSAICTIETNVLCIVVQDYCKHIHTIQSYLMSCFLALLLLELDPKQEELWL